MYVTIDRTTGGPWRRRAQSGARTPEPGYLYFLRHPRMPGLTRIGATNREPEQRAAELNSTAVPGPFEMYGEAACEDWREAERAVYDLLGSRRIDGTAFFEVEATDAVRIVADALGREPERHPARKQRSRLRAVAKTFLRLALGAAAAYAAVLVWAFVS